MSSNNRTSFALLILRLSVGSSACWNAWPHLHGYSLHGLNVHSGMTLMVWLLQFLCGGMMVLGLLMPWVCIPLLITALMPLRWPLPVPPILALLVVVASMVGGPGRWSASKG
ncbi:MAG: hypothetical protein IPP78_13540 [Holophagaceae bacterium]|nr:hypothetical protein [Holophagaceae bacterium]